MTAYRRVTIRPGKLVPIRPLTLKLGCTNDPYKANSKNVSVKIFLEKIDLSPRATPIRPLTPRFGSANDSYKVTRASTDFCFNRGELFFRML